MVTTSYPRFTGDPTGTFVASLAQGLVAAGERVTVVTPTATGTADRDISMVDGVRVIRVGTPSGLAHQPGGILPALRRAPWRVFRIPGMLRTLEMEAARLAAEADIMHGHWVYPGGWIAVRAAESARIPSIVTGHGADLNLLARLPLLRNRVRWVLQHASRTLAVSQALQAAALAAGAPPDRVSVIPLGVIGGNPDAAVPGASAFGSHPGLKLLSVGSLTVRKGHDVLIKAFAMLDPAQAPVLAILGEGPEYENLVGLAQRLGVVERVIFTGNTPPDQIHGWMRSADVFVMPSRAEGLGLVCVEAMMAGTPVIASDIPGPRELLQSGDAGRLVPPGDPAALARAIDLLAKDAKLRESLGRQGIAQVVREGRTRADSVRRHQEVYRALRGRKP